MKPDLTSQISTVAGIRDDAAYDIKHTRNPNKKRLAQITLDFFQSILESLQELETIKKLEKTA